MAGTSPAPQGAGLGRSDATEVKLRAERKAGVALAAMEKQGPGQYQRFPEGTVGLPPRLADISISKKQAMHWRGPGAGQGLPRPVGWTRPTSVPDRPREALRPGCPIPRGQPRSRCSARRPCSDSPRGMISFASLSPTVEHHPSRPGRRGGQGRRWRWDSETQAFRGTVVPTAAGPLLLVSQQFIILVYGHAQLDALILVHGEGPPVGMWPSYRRARRDTVKRSTVPGVVRPIPGRAPRPDGRGALRRQVPNVP